MVDTIFAIATARGRAGVAVIRVSGPASFDSAKAICGTVPATRKAVLRSLRDLDGGEVIDEGLVIAFDRDASFTGENTVEYQIHGSISVQNRMLSCLAKAKGHRSAEPGEFTRRALENGRMDLSQVEGLADLIEAETDAQRRQALKVMRGSVSALVSGWRQELVQAAALIAASIDFSDEDIPDNVTAEVVESIDKVTNDLRYQLDGAVAAERIRDGFEIAIVGAPNSGKSTLLNAISGREAAITSEIAGTTRDVIEVRLDLRGLPVTLLDTAGLRETEDVVESIGIKRARERADSADLRVFLSDDGIHNPEMGVRCQDEDIVLRGKADTSRGTAPGVSGLTGIGVPELLDRIATILEKRSSSATSIIRERQRLTLESALFSLESARIHVLNAPEDIDFAAEDLQRALRALDILIGKVDVEDLLDEIFASFCLGK